jgi:hypothetical protein
MGCASFFKIPLRMPSDLQLLQGQIHRIHDGVTPAVMRKLIVLMNHILKNPQLCTPKSNTVAPRRLAAGEKCT